MRRLLEVVLANPLFSGCRFAISLLGINLAVTLLATDPQQKTVFADVIAPVVDFLAGAALFIAARQSAIHSRRLASAWGYDWARDACLWSGRYHVGNP